MIENIFFEKIIYINDGENKNQERGGIEDYGENIFFCSARPRARTLCSPASLAGRRGTRPG